MFAVIFKATIAQLDEEYTAMASRLRDLAMNEYGCIEFSSCMEGNTEIAISYWPSEAHIQKWRNDIEHLKAQALGKNKWYRSFSVEVVEVIRRYERLSDV